MQTFIFCFSFVLCCFASCAWLLVKAPAVMAAENLRLKDGISFYQDTDAGFPIIGDEMEDVSLAKDRPTFIFFGASGDLNTNRQARRIVDLYKHYKSSGIKFVVIDVDKPVSSEAKHLIKSYYRGFIPFQIILDKENIKCWSQIGEVDEHLLQSQIDKVLQQHGALR